MPSDLRGSTGREGRMATFGDRLKVAVKAAVGIFDDNAMRAAHGMLAGIFPAAGGTPPLRGTKEQLEAFRSMPWLHAAADKVASAFASVEWQLFAVRRTGERARQVKALQRASAPQRKALRLRVKQVGELVPIEDHPMLDLLHDANSFQPGLSMLKVAMLHYDLVGDAFLLKERNGLSSPTALWPIPPHWVLRMPTPSDRTFRVGFRGWHGDIPDTEFLWINNPDPAHPYGRGVGMAQALADELETDEYASKHTRQLFYNQARPDFLVMPKEFPARENQLSEANAQRLERWWLDRAQGFWRAFKPLFLTREVKIHEFDAQANLRALQFVPLREFERDSILQVWGIPPELMGILENSNRATITAASYLFARWVLIPRLEAWRAHLQERLVPEFDERLILDYIDPVDADPDLQLEAGRIAPWALTIDEWRARQGEAALEEERGQVFALPFNLTLSRLEEMGALPPAGASVDLRKLTDDELLILRAMGAQER